MIGLFSSCAPMCRGIRHQQRRSTESTRADGGAQGGHGAGFRSKLGQGRGWGGVGVGWGMVGRVAIRGMRQQKTEVRAVANHARGRGVSPVHTPPPRGGGWGTVFPGVGNDKGGGLPHSCMFLPLLQLGEPNFTEAGVPSCTPGRGGGSEGTLGGGLVRTPPPPTPVGVGQFLAGWGMGGSIGVGDG